MKPVVQDLRCESELEPLGLDEPSPRLSWRIQRDGRGWVQQAYHVLVASSVQRVERDKGDIWDSGLVLSNQQSHLPYSGRPLQAHAEYWWKVRVTGMSGGISEWSAVARWEMGPLSEREWGGAWIGGKNDTSGGPAPYLRRSFQVHGRVRRARLHVCGLGFADVYLNAVRIGGLSERDPGTSAFDKRVLYVTHDVTLALREGENAIGAILGGGWYDVHEHAVWEFHKAPWRARPRLRLLLTIDYEDGTSAIVASDSSWKTATGPILRDGIYSGETYDARLEIPNWASAEFDDTSWATATVFSPLGARLSRRRCPPVTIARSIAPKSIVEPERGVFVVDFGENIAGHAQLLLKDMPRGTTLTLRYSERVDSSGNIDRAAISKYMDPGQPFQTDTYVCAGGPQEVWEQRFSYSGFRYVEVRGFPGTPGIENFRGRVAHTNLESAGGFACSNLLLNRIHEATRVSYLCNAQSILTDCPQREKLGWTGDAHLASDTGLLNFASHGMYEKWLEDATDSVRDDGTFPVIVPCSGWGLKWPGPHNTSFDVAYHLIAWNLYLYTGDARPLIRHYAPLRGYVDLILTLSPAGIVPEQVLGDWLPWSETAPAELVATAFLWRATDIVARTAELMGNANEAMHYHARARAIEGAFNAKFFEEERSSYAHGTHCALALPLDFGLVPPNALPAVAAVLAQSVGETGHVDAGIFGTKSLLRALSKTGHSELAYQVATYPEQPGWAWFLHAGGNTLWEGWREDGSLNHIMLGDISAWCIQHVAGIRPDPEHPGFRRVLIQPGAVGDLSSARAWHASPMGRISVDWERGPTGFALNVEIPPGSSARVWIPADASDTILEGNKLAEQASGVQLILREQSCAVYEIGSGNYAFRTVHSESTA